MESEAPAIPQLLLPSTDAKPEYPITFKWQSVTDPSGVTYGLQVAKDKDFTNIVLEKEGLTKSEYTVTKTEDKGLGSTKKDATYWWQVRAIDGALNMSAWSAAKPFAVSFNLPIPSWIWYLLGVLGCLLLLFIGLVLVKRRHKTTLQSHVI